MAGLLVAPHFSTIVKPSSNSYFSNYTLCAFCLERGVHNTTSISPPKVNYPVLWLKVFIMCAQQDDDGIPRDESRNASTGKDVHEGGSTWKEREPTTCCFLANATS